MAANNGRVGMSCDDLGKLNERVQELEDGVRLALTVLRHLPKFELWEPVVSRNTEFRDSSQLAAELVRLLK